MKDERLTLDNEQTIRIPLSIWDTLRPERVSSSLQAGELVLYAIAWRMDDVVLSPALVVDVREDITHGLRNVYDIVCRGRTVKNVTMVSLIRYDVGVAQYTAHRLNSEWNTR